MEFLLRIVVPVAGLRLRPRIDDPHLREQTHVREEEEVEDIDTPVLRCRFENPVS